ncbi:MAG: MptD family putative ECF transporter S component [Clostridiales Family XIII bacterium]|jgi:energy-coupling factor transport system substrate-specific component|nr:MptD family putative ECF transporter S component [Clostridiales Family XIII bacterium]
MNPNKLKAKDLITLAIFSVVFIAVYMVCAIPTGLIVQLYPFCAGIAMIPCGIVWAYLRTKAPKPLAILIQGVLFAVIVFIMGSGWFVSVGVFAGGVLAEIIAGIGGYKSFKLTVISYAVFGLCFDLGGFLIILLAGDYYYENSIKLGADTTYMDTLMNFMGGPVLAIACVLTVIGAIIGMLLGRAFLKKHFERAGIV